MATVEVRQTFKASRVGTIAGSMVTDGTVTRGAKVRLVRDGTIVYDGRIGSLRRFKDDVREVTQGMECGIVLENFADVKEGDVLEVYETQQVERDARVGHGVPVPAWSWSSTSPRTVDLKGKRKELQFAEGTASAALRRGRGRDRPPRPVAAGDARRSRWWDASAARSTRRPTRSSGSSTPVSEDWTRWERTVLATNELREG